MFEFFSFIQTILSAALDWVVSALSTLIMIFQSIFVSVEYLFLTVAYMPPFLAAFIYMSIAFTVVYFIIGRD